MKNLKAIDRLEEQDPAKHLEVYADAETFNKERKLQSSARVRELHAYDGINNQISCWTENRRILLKMGDHLEFVQLDSIYRFEAVGNQVGIYFEGGQSCLQTSLCTIEGHLDPDVFVKVSRSNILRVGHISRLEQGMQPGTMDAILNTGDVVGVSRRQAQMIRKRFGM